MATRTRDREPEEQATFVFKGTVQRLGGATMASVPVDDKTAVVRVDEVLRAPETLAGYAGHDVTVQLAPTETVRRGAQVVFHTNGWLFGEGVAVRSLGHTPAGAAAAAGGPTSAVQAKADRDFQAHAADADLVVTGRVATVRVPAERASARGAELPEPISEHSPVWREAVIDVDGVTKGRSAAKQVVVRFPSSTDVRWATAPKLQPGQAGVFLLHKAEPARTKGLAKSGGAVYTVLHREDVQPPHRAAALGARPAPSGRATRPPSRRPGSRRPRG